ncbi:PAS domain-containing protein [Haliangium sp.]|uniref:PAS domain-containing protein n=1 Tax=Haliangium sp. TaxID=2663208 RepID=UPI003D12CEB2
MNEDLDAPAGRPPGDHHPLQDELRLLRGAVAAAGAGTFFVTRDHAQYDQRTRDILGLSAADSDQDLSRWLAAIHPDDQARVGALISAIRTSDQTSFDWRYRITRPDGAPCTVRAVGMVRRDPAGDIRSVSGLVFDVTEEVETQAARAELDSRLSFLLELNPAILYALDGRDPTRVVYISPSVRDVLGYTPEQIEYDVGWWRSLVHPEDREVALATIDATLWTQGRATVVYRLRKADGSYLWLQDQSLLARPQSGAPSQVVGCLTDISDRMQIEQALVHARETALAASRVKSQFLANTSHEIRTPLSGVLGMAELLLDTELSVEQRELLGALYSSASALRDLIEDVLDISKIEAGKLELEEVAFSPAEVIYDLARSIAIRAHEKGLELVVDVDTEVPPEVCGDPVRYRQIVLNLLGNAIKFTPQGQVLVVVRRTDDGHIETSVHDTGVGVPPERREAIFEAFTQSDGSTARRFGGTGLGLAICRELVERMGGRLWYEPAPDGGSVFRFSVPLPRWVGPPQADDSPASLADAERWHELRELAGASVLLAVPNPGLREVLTRHLERWQFEVHACSEASEALDMASDALYAGRGFRYALIDKDLGDGDEAGLDLIEALSGDRRFATITRILLMNSSKRPALQTRERLAIAYCVTKPVTPTALRDAFLARHPSLPPMQSAPMEAPAPTATQTTPSLAGARVLLAEDDPTNALLAKRLLVRGGHRVTHVTTGAAAFEAWLTQPFDLVLMDVQMPELDGLETSRRIRAEEERRGGARTCIVALTANALAEDEARCLEAGMDAYLPKPVHRDALSAILANLGADEPTPPLATPSPPPAPQARAASPPRRFDLDALLDRLGGDHEIAGFILEEFARQAEIQRDAIAAAVAAGDMGTLTQTAHRAKGSLLTLEATETAILAEALERAAAYGEHDSIAGLWARFEASWTEVVEEVRAELAGAGQPPPA